MRPVISTFDGTDEAWPPGENVASRRPFRQQQDPIRRVTVMRTSNRRETGAASLGRAVLPSPRPVATRPGLEGPGAGSAAVGYTVESARPDGRTGGR